MDARQHTVTLATGVRSDLIDVAGILLVLDRLLASTPQHRNLVRRLRQTCLNGDNAPEDAVPAFAAFGLGDHAGMIFPEVRQVVLAAVRGEDTDLHIVSPFVDAWDRALSDLVISREKVRAHLPAQEAEDLIRSTMITDEAQPKSGESWLNYVLKKRHGDSLPPFSSN